MVAVGHLGKIVDSPKFSQWEEENICYSEFHL